MDPKKLRRFKRFPFRKRVRFGTKSPDYMGHTVNFSKMGLQIEATKLFPRGTPLVVEILDNLTPSGSDKPITFLAKVVWAKRDISKRGKMGIEFLTQSKEIDDEYDRISN